MTPLFNLASAITVANTVTETSLIQPGPPSGTLLLPPNLLSVGFGLRFRAAGFHSVTLTPTLRLKFKLGSTVILDTTALSVGTGSNQQFIFDGLITCQVQGASGKLYAQGEFREPGASTNAYSVANTAQTSFDTTAAALIDLTATWSAASASNTVTCSNCLIELSR